MILYCTSYKLNWHASNNLCLVRKKGNIYSLTVVVIIIEKHLCQTFIYVYINIGTIKY